MGWYKDGKNWDFDPTLADPQSFSYQSLWTYAAPDPGFSASTGSEDKMYPCEVTVSFPLPSGKRVCLEVSHRMTDADFEFFRQFIDTVKPSLVQVTGNGSPEKGPELPHSITQAER